MHSLKVVDFAIELARKLSYSILLVTVIKAESQEPEGIVAFEKAEEYPDAYADYLQSRGDAITGKLSERIKQAGVQSRAISPTGNPASEITEIAEVEKVKLIVVGVKGLHGIAKIRSLGSVARRVVENAPVPVIVVPT